MLAYMFGLPHWFLTSIVIYVSSVFVPSSLLYSPDWGWELVNMCRVKTFIPLSDKSWLPWCVPTTGTCNIGHGRPGYEATCMCLYVRLCHTSDVNLLSEMTSLDSHTWWLEVLNMVQWGYMHANHLFEMHLECGKASKKSSLLVWVWM